SSDLKFGSDDLTGKKVLVQGIGNVGETLVKHLTNAGALVTITDLNAERVAEVANKYNTTIFNGDDLYSLDVDIYAPCALGATVNDDSINKLKAKVIAGAANNQLENESVHGKMLQDKGIVYAPDFLINAGGIINVFGEIAKYGSDEAMRRTENIYNTTLDILNYAKEQNRSEEHTSELQSRENLVCRLLL